MNNLHQPGNDNNEALVDVNQHHSDERAAVKEDDIKTYEELVPDGKAHEDIPEVSSTDDV